MKTCPDCGAPMEREQLADLVKLGGGYQYDCPGCGAEWIWEQGPKGLRKIGDGNLDVVSFFEARGVRREA